MGCFRSYLSTVRFSSQSWKRSICAQKRATRASGSALVTWKSPYMWEAKEEPWNCFTKWRTQANIPQVWDVHLWRRLFSNYNSSALFKYWKAALNSSSSLTEPWLLDGPFELSVRADKPGTVHVNKDTEVFQRQHLELVCSKTADSYPCCTCVKDFCSLSDLVERLEI